MDNTLQCLFDSDVAVQFYESNQNYKSDSGFNLFFLESYSFSSGKTKGFLIDFKIKAALREKGERKGLLLVPRSSIYKTPVRMSNSIGIIDAGYNGTLKVPVDIDCDKPFTIEKGTSLFQIVDPTLQPFHIERFLQLEQTERGEGGFGSTNK